jgi:2-keto-4-pentenoate hydratase
LGKDEDKKKVWCDALWDAVNGATSVDTSNLGLKELSVDEAYAVQSMVAERRIRNGERIIWWKVGATSQAVLNQFKGVTDEPILGCMTSNSIHTNVTGIKASEFCTLGFEGEIAFVMEKPLRGPGVTSADVLRATFGVTASTELIDFRVKSRDGNIAAVIADNSGHAGIILGPVVKPVTGLDLRLEGVMVTKNGILLGSACGCEALGNPINVVTWLANKLAQFDRGLEAGDIITTGSLTRYFLVEPGDTIDVSYTNLGSIQFRVTE